MEFNQNANPHYGIGPAYPPYPCYPYNPGFGDCPPPGLHVAPRAQPPSMNQEHINWSSTYGYPPYDYAYSAPSSHPQMWASSTYGTSQMGQSSLPPPPPNVVRPTLHRDPWHNIEANCDAFFGERRATRRKSKSRQSKSKPGTVNIEIKTAPKKRNGGAPQSHEQIHGQTDGIPIRPRFQRIPSTFDHDRTPSPVSYRDDRSHIPSNRRRQPPQSHAEEVEDYEGDYREEFEERFRDSYPATPRQECPRPSRARSESMPQSIHPPLNERPVPESAGANRQRNNSGTTANMTRLRNEVGSTHGNAALSRQGSSMMPPGRETHDNKPTVPEPPRQGYGNPQDQVGKRRMTTEDHIRAAMEHMHALSPSTYQEPPRGVNAEDHLVTSIESLLSQHRQRKEGSVRSRASTDDGSAAILMSVLDILKMHVETRSREASIVSGSGVWN